MKQADAEGWRAGMIASVGIGEQVVEGSRVDWQVSCGPEAIERKTTFSNDLKLGNITTKQARGLKYKLPLKQKQQSGKEWVTSLSRYAAG